MMKRRDEGGGGRRNPPEKGREGDRGEEYVSGEEVRFSLLYSRTMDRLTPPIRASNKKHHSKPNGLLNRVGGKTKVGEKD